MVGFLTFFSLKRAAADWHEAESIQHCIKTLILSTGENMVPESIQRVMEIVGKEIAFQELDVLDERGLQELFKKV